MADYKESKTSPIWHLICLHSCYIFLFSSLWVLDNVFMWLPWGKIFSRWFRTKDNPFLWYGNQEIHSYSFASLTFLRFRKFVYAVLSSEIQILQNPCSMNMKLKYFLCSIKSLAAEDLKDIQSQVCVFHKTSVFPEFRSYLFHTELKLVP